METVNVSFLNIMLCYYFSLEAVLQGLAKNNLTKKQIDAEIQATLKHVPAWKLREGKMQSLSLQKAKTDLNYKLQHSHKKRKDSLETWAVLTEISILCWNLPSGPKHRGSLPKNMAFPEGNKLFVGDLRANLDETNADMIQFIKRWKWNWIV